MLYKMNIGILYENQDDRVVLTPADAKKLQDQGFSVSVEKNAGQSAFYPDAAYEEAGARIEDHAAVLSGADLLVSLFPREDSEYAQLPDNAYIISSFQPFADPEAYQRLAQKQRTVFSLDLMPRTTQAQDKDVLSSQASVAGYQAVLEAAQRLPRYFPMLSTAAGTVPPARVLILGAGVAGLQAIATARRLGSQVEAFDVRKAAKEEVQSLGAKFIEVEGAQDDSAAGGYAVEQTEDFKQRQRELLAQRVGAADVVITTALVRGRKAPELITREMVESMKPGSVIVDLAAAAGGNCRLTEEYKTVNHQGVLIYGHSSLQAHVPQHASQLYGKNIVNFLSFLQLNAEGGWQPDFENPIVDGTCMVYAGEARHQEATVSS